MIKLVTTARGLTVLAIWFTLFVVFSQTALKIAELFEDLPSKGFYSAIVGLIILITLVYSNINVFGMNVPGQEIWVTSNSQRKDKNPLTTEDPSFNEQAEQGEPIMPASFPTSNSSPDELITPPQVQPSVSAPVVLTPRVKIPLTAHYTGYTFLFPGETVYRKIHLTREKLEIRSDPKKDGKHKVYTSADGAPIMVEWVDIAWVNEKLPLRYVLHDPESISEMVTGEIEAEIGAWISIHKEVDVLAHADELREKVAKKFGGEKVLSPTELAYGLILKDPVVGIIELTPEIRKARSDIAQMEHEQEEAFRMIESAKKNHLTLSLEDAMEAVMLKREQIGKQIIHIEGVPNATHVAIGHGTDLTGGHAPGGGGGGSGNRGNQKPRN